MKLKNTILFILVLAIVGLSSFVAIRGASFGKYKIEKASESIDLGLDLAGGVYVVLEAKTDAKGEELQRLMEQTKAVINERVNGLGVSEPNIAIEGENRIRVELAGIEDPQEAIDLIGKTAQLQFVDPDGKVVITGKNVKSSEVKFQNLESGQQQVVVGLSFDKEGTKNFAEATDRLAKETKNEDKIIYIVLDGEVISYPIVNDVITDGNAIISGGFTVDEASNLATLIRAGALPVEMEELQTSVIGPTLGLEAFDKSVKAGGIALLLIFIFMIVMYKIPGFVASIGLIVYTLIVIYSMVILKAKLTLPGIAGLILSIGMAVDANVLIFERIKEEIKVGKTIRTSINSGFNKALSSVIDSNITTLIAGIVLYYFGIGPIKGFGITLTIGILASMITAVFVTKYLLKLMESITGEKNTKLYGA